MRKFQVQITMMILAKEKGITPPDLEQALDLELGDALSEATPTITSEVASYEISVTELDKE